MMCYTQSFQLLTGKVQFMATRYRVTLMEEEINELSEITRKGHCSARMVLYARALVLLDQGEFANEKWTVEQAATAVGLTSRTLEHLKERFVNHGLEAALERKKPVRPSRKLIFDGEVAAKVTQLACSQAPHGHARWTVRLLADKLVELKIVPAISAMTVCNLLKKTSSSPTGANTGKSRPPKTPSSWRAWKTS
jgi:hypothetical protein